MLRLGLEGAIMAIRVVRNPDKLVFIDRQLGRHRNSRFGFA
jgi:hypothetical protein